jgi:hypothetical protein
LLQKKHYFYVNAKSQKMSLQTYRKNLMHWGLSIGFLLSSVVLWGQNAAVPQFKIQEVTYDTVQLKKIVTELDRFTVQPSIADAEKILTDIIDSDTSLGRHLYTFTCLAGHLNDAFSISLRKKFNARVHQLADSNESDWYLQDEENEEFLPVEDIWTDERQYNFRCLDLDQDKTIDIILMSQVYFGPSPGLVFYGLSEGRYRYLYDCSGILFSIEKNEQHTYLRFSVTIIDPSECNILSSIKYDHLKKNACLESKIYLAQQTSIPKALKPLQLFETLDSVYLRWAPKINNTEVELSSDGYPVDISSTRCLMGNVVAVFPRSATGYVLSTKGKWAFVVFNGNTKHLRCSLQHGLDDQYYDLEGKWHIRPHPAQYWCGWVETNTLKIVSNKGEE